MKDPARKEHNLNQPADADGGEQGKSRLLKLFKALISKSFAWTPVILLVVMMLVMLADQSRSWRIALVVFAVCTLLLSLAAWANWRWVGVVSWVVAVVAGLWLLGARAQARAPRFNIVEVKLTKSDGTQKTCEVPDGWEPGDPPWTGANCPLPPAKEGDTIMVKVTSNKAFESPQTCGFLQRVQALRPVVIQGELDAVGLDVADSDPEAEEDKGWICSYKVLAPHYPLGDDLYFKIKAGDEAHLSGKIPIRVVPTCTANDECVHGTCDAGVCVCADGWRGVDCAVKSTEAGDDGDTYDCAPINFGVGVVGIGENPCTEREILNTDANTSCNVNCENIYVEQDDTEIKCSSDSGLPTTSEMPTCVLRALCSTHTCGKGWIRNEQAQEDLCAGAPCSAVDNPTCCSRGPSASTGSSALHSPDQTGTGIECISKCPAAAASCLWSDGPDTYSIREYDLGLTAFRVDATCQDSSTQAQVTQCSAWDLRYTIAPCPDSRGLCGEDYRGVGMGHVTDTACQEYKQGDGAFHYNTDAATTSCAGESCNLDIAHDHSACCAPTMCSGNNDSHKDTVCGEGQTRKPHSDAIQKQGDGGNCCEAPSSEGGTCSGFTCPEGKILNQAAQDDDRGDDPSSTCCRDKIATDCPAQEVFCPVTKQCITDCTNCGEWSASPTPISDTGQYGVGNLYEAVGDSCYNPITQQPAFTDPVMQARIDSLKTEYQGLEPCPSGCCECAGFGGFDISLPTNSCDNECGLHRPVGIYNNPTCKCR